MVSLSVLGVVLARLVLFLYSARGRLWIERLRWCVVWTFTRQPALAPGARPDTDRTTPPAAAQVAPPRAPMSPRPTPRPTGAGRRIDTITAEQELWLRRQLAALAAELRRDDRP